METIIDINGYSADYDSMYDINNSWFGRILVGKDHYFEGFVQDFDQKESYFVFGELEKERLSLIKCSKSDQNIPYLFKTVKGRGKYYGDYYVKDPYVEVPLGECKLSILPAEKTREETEMEKIYLRVKIEEEKQQLGRMGSELYNFYTESRKKQEPTKK